MPESTEEKLLATIMAHPAVGTGLIQPADDLGITRFKLFDLDDELVAEGTIWPDLTWSVFSV